MVGVVHGHGVDGEPVDDAAEGVVVVGVDDVELGEEVVGVVLVPENEYSRENKTESAPWSLVLITGEIGKQEE